MILVLLGPPGAGKGTQAARLSQAFKLHHLSSGDVLRAERQNGTELGRQVARFMDVGELVPDDVIVEVILARLEQERAAGGFLLDGFPRTEAQARSLDRALPRSGRKVALTLSIDVPDGEVVDRITGRRICPACNRVYHVRYQPPASEGTCDDDGSPLVHRPDDTEEVVRQRLRAYHRQTEPLEAYYHRQGKYTRVDGTGSVEQVFEQLSAAVREHLARLGDD